MTVDQAIVVAYPDDEYGGALNTCEEYREAAVVLADEVLRLRALLADKATGSRNA